MSERRFLCGFLIVFATAFFNDACATRDKRVGIVSPKDNYVPGELIIKFKQRPSLLLTDGPVQVGIESVDRLNKKYGVYSAQLIYGYSSKTAEQQELLEKQGFDRLFLFRLSEEFDIEAVAKEYATDPNVEYAEPNYILTKQRR